MSIEINILRQGATIATVKPNIANSGQVRRIMGDNVVNLGFTLNSYINLQIGDYAFLFGENYYLNTLPIVIKEDEYRYTYTLQLQSSQYDLQKVQYMLDGQSDFSLHGTAHEFIDLLIMNANRVGSGWQKGGVVASEPKTISFSNEDCYSVLAKIAEAFGTEWYVEGNVIHLAKKQRNTGYVFRYGMGKGLYEITRSQVFGSKVITRLYAYGGTQNIPFDYRGGEVRLRMPDADYLENNVSQYGIIEGSVIYEDIFPRRNGTATAVDALNVYKFKDVDIDFNVNDQLLSGVKAKVTFNTGQLAGYTFDIDAYNHTTKEFTIAKNADEKSIDVPSTTLPIGIGDKYVLIDLRMPQSYIDAAELEVKDRAQKELDESSAPKFIYSIKTDTRYLKKYKINLDYGDIITLQDTTLQVDKPIRIAGIIKSFTNEEGVYDNDIELE